MSVVSDEKVLSGQLGSVTLESWNLQLHSFRFFLRAGDPESRNNKNLEDGGLGAMGPLHLKQGPVLGQQKLSPSAQQHPIRGPSGVVLVLQFITPFGLALTSSSLWHCALIPHQFRASATMSGFSVRVDCGGLSAIRVYQVDPYVTVATLKVLIYSDQPLPEFELVSATGHRLANDSTLAAGGVTSGMMLRVVFVVPGVADVDLNVGAWPCLACTFLNPAETDSCEICGAVKPQSERDVRERSRSPRPSNAPSLGWRPGRRFEMSYASPDPRYSNEGGTRVYTVVRQLAPGRLYARNDQGEVRTLLLARMSSFRWVS